MQETQSAQAHRERTAQQLSHEGQKYFRLIEFDENEQLVTEIRKHVVGLIIILLTGGFVMLAVLGAGIFLSSVNIGDRVGVAEVSRAQPFILLASILVLIATTVMTMIAVFLYRSNVIFVTNEKIAQVLYVSIFNRKVSQLSIGDVQDVTVEQKGILAHAFNYGTLVIETAGEQQNYTFNYVPDPHQASRLIVSAHEMNLVEHGN